MSSKNRRKVVPSPRPCTDSVGLLVYYTHNKDSQLSPDKVVKTFADLISWVYSGDNQSEYKCYSCQAILKGDAVRYRCITCQYDSMFDQCEVCRRDGLDHDNCHEFAAYYCGPSNQEPQVDGQDDAIQVRIKQLIETGILDAFDDKDGFIFDRLDSNQTISRAWSLFLVMLLHSDENDSALLQGHLLRLVPMFLKGNHAKYFSAELAECLSLVVQKQSSLKNANWGNSIMKMCIATFDSMGDDTKEQELKASAKQLLYSTLKLIHRLLLKDEEFCFEKDMTLKLGLTRTIMWVLQFRQLIRANVDMEFDLFCVGSYLDILEQPNFLLATSLKRLSSKLIAQSRYQSCSYLLERINKSSGNQMKQLNYETLILELLKKMPSTLQEFEARMEEAESICKTLRILAPNAEQNKILENKIRNLARNLHYWLSVSKPPQAGGRKKEKGSQSVQLFLDDDIPSPSPKSSDRRQEYEDDWFDDCPIIGAIRNENGAGERKENEVVGSTKSSTASAGADQHAIPWSIMLKSRAKNVQDSKTKSKSVSNPPVVTKQQQLNFNALNVEAGSSSKFPFLESISTEKLKHIGYYCIVEQSYELSRKKLLSLTEEILTTET